MIGWIEEGVDCKVVHDIAVVGKVMVVIEEGWWWVVCGHDVSDSCGGGIHGGDIVGGTRGSTIGVAAGWLCRKCNVDGQAAAFRGRYWRYSFQCFEVLDHGWLRGVDYVISRVEKR